VNLQAVLNRLTGLTIIAFIQKIGSRGSDPRLLGLIMGWCVYATVSSAYERLHKQTWRPRHRAA
jgi:hypothetical protein